MQQQQPESQPTAAAVVDPAGRRHKAGYTASSTQLLL